LIPHVQKDKQVFQVQVYLQSDLCLGFLNEHFEVNLLQEQGHQVLIHSIPLDISYDTLRIFKLIFFVESGKPLSGIESGGFQLLTAQSAELMFRRAHQG